MKRRELAALAVLGTLLGSLLVTAPAGAGSRTPMCLGRRATIVGTNSSNDIEGTRGADVIVARRGVDFIFAGAGDDRICAGRGGVDFVFAGKGDDKISGGRGFDAIFPSRGTDEIDGGPGDDFVTYEGRNIGIEANLELGFINAYGETDILRSVEGVGGGEGDDALFGDENFNQLIGAGGDDVIESGDGDDFLNAGAGDDLIDGGPGYDFLEQATAQGGPSLGDDVYATSGVTTDLANDTATGDDLGTDSVVGIEGATGTLGDDTLLGDGEFNELVGLEGNDTIDMGGAGAPIDGLHDLALPGTGDDEVIGNDAGIDGIDYGFIGYEFEPTTGATINLQIGTATGPDIGADEFSSIEYAVGTPFADSMTGSNEDDWLIGIDGRDTIDGGAGDDLLDGDAFTIGEDRQLRGIDTLDGGPGDDTCVGAESATACEAKSAPQGSRWSFGGRVHSVLRGIALLSQR